MDPLFVDVSGGNFRLFGGSPAVDTGNNGLLPPYTFDLDEDGNTSEAIPCYLEGKPRVLKGTVDMGQCLL